MNISCKPITNIVTARFNHTMTKPAVIPDISQKKDKLSFTGESDFTVDSIGNKIPKSFENLMHHLVVVRKKDDIYVDNTNEGKIVTLYSNFKNPEVNYKSEYIFSNDGTLKNVVKYIKTKNKYKLAEIRTYLQDGKTVLYTEITQCKKTDMCYFNPDGSIITEK
ncbi:MAG TPA: hypothetical protein PKI94_05110 [Candidatus Gastranaerophilaceae bacterium]|nr:hypothetical protein [Candidatus Gastranaerophilaceae bacterium]